MTVDLHTLARQAISPSIAEADAACAVLADVLLERGLIEPDANPNRRAREWAITTVRTNDHGRTTRMLEQAVASALRGERVLVIAANSRQVDQLDERMREMCGPPGFEAWRRIHVETLDQEYEGTHGMRFGVRFVDHYVEESRTRLSSPDGSVDLCST